MSDLLTTIGEKLAGTWVSPPALPGLIFLGTASTAAVLGHRRWNDAALLTARVNRLAHEPAMHSTGVTVLVLIAVVAGSAAVGLLAQATGWAIERAWLSDWTVPPGRWLTTWRRNRWNTARARYKIAIEDKYRARLRNGTRAREATEIPLPDTGHLNDARNRIALAEPCRPTWIGDRIAAVQRRVRETYDLDLAFAWPRLWLILPDVARTELRAAADRVTAAARLVAWGFLYLAVGLYWWPAVLIGVTAIGVGWLRARANMDVFAHLVEAGVDVHGRDLARALGIDIPNRLTRDAGLEITRTVRKNA